MKDSIYIYLLVAAGVTYLIRALPMTLIRKNIKNKYIRSFLYYVPYAVLGCMTLPAVLSATGSIIPSTLASISAIYFAHQQKSLVQVAVIACMVAYLTTLMMGIVL